MESKIWSESSASWVEQNVLKSSKKRPSLTRNAVNSYVDSIFLEIRLTTKLTTGVTTFS